MSLGPFDLAGGPFLALYGILLAGAVIAGFVIPRLSRPEGRPGRAADAEQLAILAGGAARYADAVMMRLLTRGAVRMQGKDAFVIAGGATAATPAEHSILRLPPPLDWSAVSRALKPYAEPVERKLVAAGLLMDAPETARARLRQTLPYLLLIGFGAIKWVVGTLRDRPVGFLTALMMLTALLGFIRWLAVDRATRSGQAALADARSSAERLRRAPTSGETDMAVALFGTAVLVGSGWAAYHQLRTAGSGDSSSSDGGGGDGGGGGCGGCSS